MESFGAAKGSWPSPSSPRCVASVCIITFLAYLSTLRFQFVHDDRGQIVGNPAVHSWHAVPGYFTSHVWAAMGPAFLANNYRPLFLLWLRINDAMFGHHAAGWHFTTVGAHVAATCCVFFLAYRILGDWPGPLCSGLIFGLHPVHIEGVAWISGVTEPLLAVLLIPAYLCWLRSRKVAGQSGFWLGASLGLYAMALLVKETAVVLPMILFASFWLDFPRPLEPRSGGRKQKFLQTLKALLPFLALTAIYLLVRMAVLKGFSHPAARVSWLTVVLTWPSLLFFYVKLLLCPAGLGPFYGLEYVSHPTLRNTLFPALVLLLLAGGLWKWASRSRPVALALPWLIFPLLPVLDIQIFGNGNFAHNRYLYLPSVGFAVLVAVALRKMKFGGQMAGRLPSVQVWTCIGLALLMGSAIQVEDRYYASDATFYSYAYSQMRNPDPIIGMDYANTLAEQGDFAHATEIYQQLITAHPDMWNAYFNLGQMYYQRGELESAAQFLSRAAAGDPTNAGAVFYLGLADLKLNRLDDAEANLRRANTLAPAAPNYHFALGMVMKVKGNLSGALAEFNKVVELDPSHQAAAQQAAEIQKQMERK